MNKNKIISLIYQYKKEILLIVLVVSGTLFIGSKIIPNLYNSFLNSQFVVTKTDNTTVQNIDTITIRYTKWNYKTYERDTVVTVLYVEKK